MASLRTQMLLRNRILADEAFYGGSASDDAIGTAASFGYARAIDHRKNPSQLSVLPGPRKISGSVVTDLILNVAQVRSGDRYGFGDQGNVYKISTSNVVTKLASTGISTGTDGLLYRSDSDALYCASHTRLHRYYPISGSPTWDVIYGPSKSIDAAAYRTGGALTYSLPTAISEAATDKNSFQPDIEPFYSIKVFVTAKGTGDWTLTLHDGLNNVLGSVTVLNAALTPGALNEFKFAAQIRGLVKPNARTYHYHLTSSNGTGTAQVATASDLSTSDYELWAYLLVDTDNALHPMAQFLQYTLIGNGNYLAVWEPLSDSNPPNNEFQRHRLTFPSGFNVCGIAVTDEFAVIACEKRSTNPNKDFQEGKLFVWDGFSTTYNQVIDVSGGAPEAIQSHENYPYFIVGDTLCCWPGGKDIVKVRKIADTDTRYTGLVDATHTYPNMMTVRNNMLHIGFPSVTNNTSIECGVHTWGTLEKNYPATWGNLNYTISSSRTVNNDGTLMLGCVRNFGDEMYISWRDGANYGLDIVDGQCKPAPIAKWRSRRFNAGASYKEKRADKLCIDTLPLPTGVTITPVIKTNNATEVPLTEFALATGDEEKIAIIPPQNSKFRRITHGFDIACDPATVTTSPIIYASALSWNTLIMEKQMQ
jgi:hypothetical protein